MGNDTTLTSLAAQLNSISGLSASVTPSGQLSISTTSAEQQVAFAGDTSGTLAALGINTFFTGTDAASLSVNNAVVAESQTFAASAGGVGVDTQVAQQLAGFANLPLASAGGATITDITTTLAANVTHGSAWPKASPALPPLFSNRCKASSNSIGVSLDDETV